jgi:hypothetical protein
LVEHYTKYRFRCRACNTEFCTGCRKAPYHKGRTCEEKTNGKLCKYDKREITDRNKGPKENICKYPQCLEIYNSVCRVPLSCGHKCHGVKKHKCLPCLEKDCPSYVNIFDQNKESKCSVCMNDFALYPLIKSHCNHLIHRKCLKELLLKKWTSPRINFNYLNCTQCGELMKFIDDFEFNNIIEEDLHLLDKINKIGKKIIQTEGLNKELEGLNLNGKEDKYIKDNFNFYLCSICKSPYYGGQRYCDQEEYYENFDPKGLICAKHDKKNLPKGSCLHGLEFLIFKCKFCCSFANYVCFGGVRTCASCHKKLSVLKDGVTNNCKGGEYCPLKIKKHDLGDCCLGCAICIIEKR